MNGPTLKKSLYAYLQQVEVLHRKGRPEYYQSLERLNAIMRLRSLRALNVVDTAVLMQLVVKYQADLIRVLPHHTNKTYPATRRKVLSMINACKQGATAQTAGTQMALWIF